MKYPILIVFLFHMFLMTSCQSGNNNGSLAEKHIQQTMNQQKKNKLLSIIHRGWVRKDYTNKLILERSAFRSFNEDEHFMELIIDTNRTCNGDTIGNPGCLENDTEMNYFKIILETRSGQ
jgi:hypothetical protein